MIAMRLRSAFFLLVLLSIPASTYAEISYPAENPPAALASSTVAEVRDEIRGIAQAPTETVTDPKPSPTDAAVQEEEGPEVSEEKINDPIEPWNRLMFTFNDRLYFWFLKPLAKGYNAVVFEDARVSVRNFFRNLLTPIRFVSTLLQGRLKAAGNELARFGINSTVGVGGLFDLAKTGYNIESTEADLGLTFGSYGIGEGFYIIWPFLGPSSLRDSVGTTGDAFLDPTNYLTPLRNAVAADAYRSFNETSLQLGEYEDLKESSIEPYIALRNAYIQHRRSLLNKK